MGNINMGTVQEKTWNDYSEKYYSYLLHCKCVIIIALLCITSGNISSLSFL